MEPKAQMSAGTGRYGRASSSVRKEAWQRHQTMLLSENRLSLTDPRARKYLQPQNEQYVFGNGADMPAGYTSPQ